MKKGSIVRHQKHGLGTIVGRSFTEGAWLVAFEMYGTDSGRAKVAKAEELAELTLRLWQESGNWYVVLRENEGESVYLSNPFGHVAWTPERQQAASFLTESEAAQWQRKAYGRISIIDAMIAGH